MERRRDNEEVRMGRFREREGLGEEGKGVLEEGQEVGCEKGRGKRNTEEEWIEREERQSKRKGRVHTEKTVVRDTEGWKISGKNRKKRKV